MIFRILWNWLTKKVRNQPLNRAFICIQTVGFAMRSAHAAKSGGQGERYTVMVRENCLFLEKSFEHVSGTLAKSKKAAIAAAFLLERERRRWEYSQACPASIVCLLHIPYQTI